MRQYLLQRGYDEIGMISLVLWGCNNAKSSSVLVPRVWPFLADELNSEIGLKNIYIYIQYLMPLGLMFIC